MKKKEKEFPYNFNVMKEYKIYKNIGYTQNNLLVNLKRWQSREVFSKYSEWEKYFKDSYLAKFNNLNDFQCYLNKKKEVCELILKVHDKIYIPIVLAEISTVFSMIDNEIELNTYIILLILLLITIVITIVILVGYNGRKSFYTKCISIIEEEK